MTEFKVLANEEKGIAFDLGKIKEEEYGEKSNNDTHIIILTRERFNKLTAKHRRSKKSPFKWAPGLVSNDMNREEFLDTLKAAKKYGPI